MRARVPACMHACLRECAHIYVVIQVCTHTCMSEGQRRMCVIPLIHALTEAGGRLTASKAPATLLLQSPQTSNGATWSLEILSSTPFFWLSILFGLDVAVNLIFREEHESLCIKKLVRQVCSSQILLLFLDLDGRMISSVETLVWHWVFFLIFLDGKNLLSHVPSNGIWWSISPFSTPNSIWPCTSLQRDTLLTWSLHGKIFYCFSTTWCPLCSAFSHCCVL